ncbi:putative Rhs family protein [Candidatus Termititenax aidoneus]|uniref:Rhs family protein n=1 Tax=Termititenax aidoneus TaxID=2218524 RepID=A0A388T7S7_TERA1|nr:putative Rhs family protein [Candidatus Termititenax aidoneus]
MNNNKITVEYEKLFDKVTDSKTKQKTRTRTEAKWNYIEAAGLYEEIAAQTLLPSIPGLGLALSSYQGLMKAILDDEDKVAAFAKHALFDSALDIGGNTDQQFQEVLERQVLSNVYSKYMTEAATDIILSAMEMVPPGPWQMPAKASIFVGSQYLMHASVSDTRYKSEVKYGVSGWRPKRVMDTLGRKIEFGYGRDYDSEHIGDSQIRYVKYKDVNGNDAQIEYHYDGQGYLDKVTYPAGNPIEYKYRAHEYGKLLSAAQHPSGYRSEYEYRWYQPNADVTTLTPVSGEENKRWSYYLVSKKTHQDGEGDRRETNYEYRNGAYYNLNKEGNIEGRRWEFQKHKVIDALGQVTEKEYIIGQPYYIIYPPMDIGNGETTQRRERNEYDILGRTYLLERRVILKGTNMQEKRYSYDEYGQVTQVVDEGFYNVTRDQRITRIRYDDSLHHKEINVFGTTLNMLDGPNIYGLVAEQYVEEPEKDAGKKYGHVKREYDGRGRLTKEQKYYTDSSFIEDRYEYDSSGNITTHRDPNGNPTTYTYQYNAYPQTQSKIVDGKTYRTESNYSQHTGALLDRRDENDYRIEYAYDKLGRKIKERHPDGAEIKTAYLDNLYRTEVTDRKSRKTIYNYNPYGELKTVTDPLYNTTTYKTDKLGRLETISLADGRQYKYGYDVLNRATRITYPDGSSGVKGYEDSRNRVSVYDENGHGYMYDRDAYGNLIRVVRGDNNSDLQYEYEYNALKSIASPPRYAPEDILHIYGATRYVTGFANDLLGRRTRKTQPDGTSEQFYYDANSNLTKHINYEGKQIDYTYDGLNRVKDEVYGDTQYNVYYEYDDGANALTRLTKVEDSSGTTEYKYNDLGLITEEKKTFMVGSTPLTNQGTEYTTKYEYDNTGLLLSIEYPQVHGQNVNVSYEYDDLDRIKSLKLNGSALITNTYDNTGRLTQKDYSNGVRETYKYDAKDRLVEHEAAVRQAHRPMAEPVSYGYAGEAIFLYKYEYDAAGNMVRRDITDGNVLRRMDTYEYDYINQLKVVNVPGARDLELSYDETFNRTSMKHEYGMISYNYNTTMNFLLNYAEDTDGDGAYEMSVQYAYDRQGNPVSKVYRDLRDGQSVRETARENYVWNDRDELTKIEGRVTESYVYDYRGLRHVKQNPDNTYKYVYLQNSQPALKESVSENYTDIYVYEGTRRVARVRFDSAHRTETEIFINNYQGSPVVVLSDTGDIQYQKYLDPWGNMEMEVGVPSSDIEFQYTDKEYDEDVMFYNFWRRYYDPYAGRFIGRDRVHLEDNLTKFFSTNPYSYTKNNPLKYVDTDGKDAVLYITNDIPGAGHMGSFYQDNKGNWYRQDLAATNSKRPLSVTGLDVQADWKVQRYEKASKADILDVVNLDNKIVSALYIEIDDPDKDQAVFDFYSNAQSEMKSGNNNYNLYQDNCALNTIKGINAAGIGLDESFIPSLGYTKNVQKNMDKSVYDLGIPNANISTFTIPTPMNDGMEVIK